MKDQEKSWWMCSECENVFQSEIAPSACPNCSKICTFLNVTCFIPECGGPDNVDMRLVAAKSAESRRK